MANKLTNIQKNEYNTDKLSIALALSAAAAIFSFANMFMGSISEDKIVKAVEQVEALKAGGSENRAKLQQLYTSPTFKQKQGESIDAALAQMGGSAQAPSNPQANNPAAPAKTNELSQEQVAGVLDNVFMDGDKNSDIVLIEYSDFECPFCQKHFENGTIANLIKSRNIATVFKQFPLNFHPLAQKAAEGNYCVGKTLNNAGKYFTYIEEVFKSKNPTLETITKIATDLGAKEAEFKKCLDGNETASQVAADMQEGQTLFGVNGTPGNVILNKKTGKFVVVSGAQPVSAFEQAIDQVK